MGTRLLAAAALVALLFGLWLARGRGHEPRDAVEVPRTEQRTETEPSTEVELTGAGQRSTRELAAPATEVAVADANPGPAWPERLAPARLPVERERAQLRLAVQDQGSQPVAGALVSVSPCAGPTHDLLALDDGRGPARSTTAGGDGLAVFDDLPLGAFWVHAELDDFRALARVLHEDASRAQVVVLDRTALPARFSVRVVDSEQRPVPGALVRLHARLNAGALFPEWSQLPAEGIPALADETGTAWFDDPGFVGLVAIASADDGRTGSGFVWAMDLQRAMHGGGLVVEVGAPCELSGELRGLPAAELSHARVLAVLCANFTPAQTTHAAPPFEAPVVDGAYRFASLPAGAYALLLADPNGARLELQPALFGGELENSVAPVHVVIRPGERLVRDLDVARGGAVEGVVRTPAGEPLAGALVRATFAPASPNFPSGFTLRGVHVWRFDARAAPGVEHPEIHRLATTGADGRYALAGLHPGRHRIEVAAPGLSFDRRGEVAVDAGETVRLEHVLEPAGAIQGVRRFGTYLGVTRAGEASPRMIAILPRDGVFAFPGLEPGRYVLSAFHSDAAIAPVPLTEVDVVAGRTSWVDVDGSAELAVRVRGRVMDAAGPVEGARVRLHPQVTTTGADGRFEFRAAFHVRVTPVVEIGPLRFEFALGVTGPGAEMWEGDLVLAGDELSLVTRDALGTPSSALVSLQSLDPLGPGLARVVADELAVPEHGELVVDNIPAGRYSLRASFPDGSEVVRVHTLPSVSPLELRAPPSGEIDVLVHAPSSPVPAREVIVRTWTGEGPAPEENAAFVASSVQRSALTGADGRALVRGVVAGTVRVEIFDPYGNFESLLKRPAPQVVELAPGERVSLRFDL